MGVCKETEAVQETEEVQDTRVEPGLDHHDASQAIRLYGELVRSQSQDGTTADTRVEEDKPEPTAADDPPSSSVHCQETQQPIGLSIQVTSQADSENAILLAARDSEKVDRAYKFQTHCPNPIKVCYKYLHECLLLLIIQYSV